MLIFRTSQTADYVHNSDPDCDTDGKKAPDDGWYLAEGQPAGATRFTVRPMNGDEWKSLVSIDDAFSQIRTACKTGLVKIGGEDPPKDLISGMEQEIGALVVALSTNPMTGRSSGSTEDRSQDTNALP
jgi:hypothetical protein